MTESERVIQGLDCVSGFGECLKSESFAGGICAYCVREIAKKSKELLKECDTVEYALNVLRKHGWKEEREWNDLYDDKTGHWIVLEDCSNSGIYCSECHVKVFDFTHKPKEKISKYCPHCGARMIWEL